MTDYSTLAIIFVAGFSLGYLLHLFISSPRSVKSHQLSLTDQIRKQNGNNANEMVLPEDFKYDLDEKDVNVLLYFRYQDEKFIREELIRRGILREKILSINPTHIVLIEISSFGLIHHLPVLCGTFPTVYPFEPGD